MERKIGTSAYGLRAPIIQKGDDLKTIVADTLIEATSGDNLKLDDKDVLAITESLVARAQGNYCHIDNITEDLNNKFDESIGVLFPIISRNRFYTTLKAIANTKKRIVIFLNYPSDEVGNTLFDKDLITKNGINIYKDTLNEAQYRDLVGGKFLHPFTGVDYIDLYKSLAINDNIEVYLSNDPLDILNYTKEVLVANIHDRVILKELLKQNGATKVYGLDDIMTEPINGSGYNPVYGLYGSNLSTKESVKLFPRDSQEFVDDLQKIIKERTGKDIEVMVYGDGAFKDPVGKIWELADPVVSPGFTRGLLGTPNELKLKYVADNELVGFSKDEAEKKFIEKLNQKKSEVLENDERLGTTPRRITDLLGSLADLISGSGDRGTPIVLIKGYFDNYASK